MQSERKIILDLVDLVEAWMNGIFKSSGVTWTEPPPALKRAKEYLNSEEEIPF
jgi:hypothetical protein